jgi:hypothetical protein
MAKKAIKKRGRKFGVKVGPYKSTISLRHLYQELKLLRARVARCERRL